MNRRRNHPPRGRGEAGFTLIELIMVIMIMSIALPGIINVGQNCVQGMRQGPYVTQATALAQEKLEMVMADYDDWSRGWSYITGANYASEASVTGFSGYNRVTTISPDSTYDGTTFRNVSVRVTCPDSTRVTLFTFVVQ